MLSTADINLAIHGALQDGAEIAEWVLDLLQVYGLAREVFKVMHYDLLPIWDKHCNSIVFGILLQASFCLLNLDLDLLEAAQINFVENLVLDLFEILLLKFDLIRNGLNFLVKVFNFLFINRNMLDLMSRQARVTVN